MQEKACLHVLIIEDSEDDLLLLLRELRKGRFQIEYSCVANAQDLEKSLEGHPWDVILSDYNLPGFGAMSALAILTRRELDIPFIIVSGAVGEETAVAAMRAGAHDYVMKGNLARLLPAIERELREAASRKARREAEQAVFRAKEEAIAASRAKSNFLAQMSHEIRTPLGAILGFSELLLASHDDEETRRETVEIIVRNGQNLLQIVDEILDMSKVEAGMLSIENIPFSLPEMLNDLENLFMPKAREKNLQLKFSRELRLPQEIQTDPNRLRQILINIIGNAIKFTSSGSVSLMVSLAEPQDGKQTLEFTVTDTGVGIARELQSFLFKPFSQADSSISRRFGGTGLGLALSKQLARLLQGDLVLTASEPGKGSTFTLRVAVDVKEAETQVARQAPVQDSTGSHLQLSDVRILLVDDSQDNRLLVTRILKSSGAIVDIAVNGREAIDKALDQVHDLVLMDMQMPVMDGYAAVRALRDRGFPKPIIALTANAMSSERMRCLEAGCDDFHPKPIDRPVLMHLISSYVTPPPAT
ncbi:hybrid sensor histidine kinase/response regulator [Oligoflexus tunisiensis]|uniref:hybrid sensor histidine kinase/response regulator n=1 Tax=Oligoflexus tunisiensis TaxID=708132 RepID=UPI00114CE9CC|nr:hybrid sensor histidine kinase/response regulator [Oligoflexus tunisiensis]